MEQGLIFRKQVYMKNTFFFVGSKEHQQNRKGLGLQKDGKLQVLDEQVITWRSPLLAIDSAKSTQRFLI